ncbi:MAG: ABC transporter substrate-binding protein [Alphaproteobacteria bacterium]|nr:ABC transporter substrate-binding protein [Alphaproteobacteria bacterium]
MKKFLLSLCMVLALTACKDENKTNEQANVKPTIKIGAIFPLSGPQASMGEAAKAGMLKALKEKNMSDLHYNYELVFEDNMGKIQVMPTAATKLITQDKVDAISTITSAFAKVIAPLADQHNILLWDYSFEDKNYPRFGKYAFNQGVSVQDLADKFFSEFIMNDNIENVAVYVQNVGILGLLTNSLETKMQQQGIKYVINASNPGERDFRLSIAKNQENGFNKFLIMSFPPEREIILKQLLEAGITKKDIYTGCLDMSPVIELYEGIKTVTYGHGSQDFVDNLAKEYNLSSTFSATAFYDFVNLVIEASENLYKKGEKPTAEQINNYILAKGKYPCASGECDVKANGFILNQPISLICRNQKWQEIQ